MKAVFAVAVAVIAVAMVVLGGMDAYLFLSPPLLGAVLLVSALPVILAAVIWPPIGVLVTGVVFFVFDLMTVADVHQWANLAPVVVAVLLIDVLALAAAGWRDVSARRAAERDALARVARAISEKRDLAAFAAVLATNGPDVVGSGRLELWVLDRPRAELRRVGEDGGLGAEPAGAALRPPPDRVPLDTSDPRAQAVECQELVEGRVAAEPDRDRDAPWNRPIRGRWWDWGPLYAVFPFSFFAFLGLARGLGAPRNLDRAVAAEPLRWRGETVGVLAFERPAGSVEPLAQPNRSRLHLLTVLCAAAVGSIPTGLYASARR